MPAELQDTWFNGLTLAAQGKIKTRWDAVVGTSDLWHNNVATISNAAYKSYPNPAFVSKRGRSVSTIVGIQLKKLDKAFTKAKANHDDQFANAGSKYISEVNAKAGNWTANMPETLALSGDRFEGKRGPASIHVRLLSSDQTGLRDVGGATNFSGVIDPLTQVTPEHRYIKPGLSNIFRAALEGLILQTGVFILRGDVTDPTDANTLLTALFTSFLLPDYTGSITFTVGAPSTLISTVAGSSPL